MEPDEGTVLERLAAFRRDVMKYGAARPGIVLEHLAERIIRLELLIEQQARKD